MRPWQWELLVVGMIPGSFVLGDILGVVGWAVGLTVLVMAFVASRQAVPEKVPYPPHPLSAGLDLRMTAMRAPLYAHLAPQMPRRRRAPVPARVSWRLLVLVGVGLVTTVFALWR